MARATALGRGAGLLLLLGLGLAPAVQAQPALSQEAWGAARPAVLRQASLETENASADTRRLAAWVLATGDSQGLPFLIVDKAAARVFAFDPRGLLWGTAPVLLGAAVGDDMLPGPADRPLSAIPPSERITPAGRFLAAPGYNLAGKNILWIDYAAAISLHPVVPGLPAERRQARLTSATAEDNRISFGCINVPAAFYDKVVHGLFAGAAGVVYILPETRALETVFFTAPTGPTTPAVSFAGLATPAAVAPGR